MDRIYSKPEDRLFLIVDKILEALVYSFALYTICYVIALGLGLSLRTLTYMGVVTAVPWILSARFILDQARLTPITAGRAGAHGSTAAHLVALAVVGALLAFLTVRPDADDAGHLCWAVCHFENPDQSVMGAYASRGLKRLTSHEDLCASLALMFNVPPVHVYHGFMSALGGALIPLAWFVLLRRLSDTPKAAFAGTCAVFILLCVDGTMHRSPGNFAFVRIWQGKAMVFHVAIPLCIAYSLDLFDRITLPRILRIAAISIAGMGLSVSSLFLIPATYGAAGLSFCVMRRDWQTVKAFLAGSVVIFGPLLAGGICFYSKTKPYLERSLETSSYPLELSAILKLVFGWPWSITLWTGVIALGLLLALRRWKIAAWLALWSAVILVPLSVPGGPEFIARNLTSRAVFWRLMYALPLVFAGAVAVALLYERSVGLRRVVFAGLCVAAICAVLLAGRVSSISPWAPLRVEFPVFRPKIPLPALAVSEQIMALLESGPMLAAQPVSLWMPVLTCRFPQALDRGNQPVASAMTNGKLVSDLVNGKTSSAEALRAFQGAVLTQRFRYVILKGGVNSQEEVRRTLKQAGYVHVATVGRGMPVYELR